MNIFLAPANFVDTVLLVTPGQEDKIEHIGVDGYFQFEFIKYENEFNHHGFTVAPRGEIYSFDKRTPWTFAENNIIHKESLLGNLTASSLIGTHIKPEELEVYFKLVSNVVGEKLSEPVNNGDGNGAVIRKIIIPDKENPSIYREYLLSQTGDIEKHNLAPAAEIISEWLNKIWLMLNRH